MKKYKILNITDWERLRPGKGTSKTYWVVNPENRRRALFKIPRYNKHKNYYAGDHWAEKIASEIAKALEIESAEIDLVVCGDIKGCISYSFLVRNQELEEAVNALNLDVTMDKRENYTFENIYSSLQEQYRKKFIEMLLFDAFIGQQDRHEENWGLIIDKEHNKAKFSPLYDNASCLGREFLPEDVIQRLRDDMCFEAYIKRKARTKIRLQKNQNSTHIEMLGYILKNHREEYFSFADKLESLENSKLKQIVGMVPDDFMSDVHKKLAIKILLARKRIVLDTLIRAR